MAHNSRDGGGKDTPEPSVARLGNSTDVESGVGAGSSAASSDDHRPVKSWKRYVWDTWDLPRAERRMLFKVDAFILTFASIGYFLKNLDQTNVNNAFLSGMKEDLNMYGNELVTSAFFLLFSFPLLPPPSAFASVSVISSFLPWLNRHLKSRSFLEVRPSGLWDMSSARYRSICS